MLCVSVLVRRWLAHFPSAHPRAVLHQAQPKQHTALLRRSVSATTRTDNSLALRGIRSPSTTAATGIKKKQDNESKVKIEMNSRQSQRFSSSSFGSGSGRGSSIGFDTDTNGDRDLSKARWGQNRNYGRRTLGSSPKLSEDEQRTHLEVLRSIRRLSDGASSTFHTMLRADSKRLPTWHRTKRKNRSSQTYISCLIDDLNWALSYLRAPLDWKHVEEMAVYIHESQSTTSRGFHNVERVFAVSGGAAPVQLLAAFFRDTINHWVDSEYSPQQAEKLKDVFLPDTYKINPEYLENNEVARLVADLFGVEPEEDLRQKYSWRRSMDIFLSALVMVQYLSNDIATKFLAQIICCLEGSIPFRNADDEGRSAVDRLHTRLVQANDTYNLEMTTVDMERTCQMAVDMHNRVMGTLSTSDGEKFIDHTWNLLPEQYPELRRTALYSLEDFYFAILDMHEFMCAIHPSIFHSFRGIPEEWEIIEFQKHLTRNQNLGKSYLEIRAVEVGIVMALAVLTGGARVPKSLFYGDLKQRSVKSPSLGESLPKLDERRVARSGCYKETYDLLTSDRITSMSFDQHSSPVAAYVYGNLGEVGLKKSFKFCVYPFNTDAASWALLESIPYNALCTLSKEIAGMAPSRAAGIEDVLKEVARRHEEE